MSCTASLPSSLKHSLFLHMQRQFLPRKSGNDAEETATNHPQKTDSHQDRADSDPLDRHPWGDGEIPLCQERLRQHAGSLTASGSGKRFRSQQSSLSAVLTLLLSGWASLQAPSRCDGAGPAEAFVAGWGLASKFCSHPLGYPTVELLHSVLLYELH